MVELRGSQTIEGMTPEDVFDAGSREENLPRELRYVELSTNDKILEYGTRIGVDLTIPRLPKLPRLPKQIAALIDGGKHNIPAEVVKCEPGRLMLIKGESDIVTTALLLKLRALKNGRDTEVIHKLEINVKGLNPLVRRAVETVLRVPMSLDVELFSEQHINNIIAYYEALATPISAKGAKKGKSGAKVSSKTASVAA